MMTHYQPDPGWMTLGDEDIPEEREMDYDPFDEDDDFPDDDDWTGFGQGFGSSIRSSEGKDCE